MTEPDAAPEAPAPAAPALDPLIEEAAKKAAVAWLAPGGAVWCLWSEGSLYVISGPGEQPAPGLAEAHGVTVTLRGDHGGRIITWQARAEAVRPGTEAWEAIAPQLAAKRLNLPSAEDTAGRWAETCVLTRLTPTGTTIALTDESGAAEAPGGGVSRRTKTPFRLHRVKRRH
ncbi:hypothetical protein [Longispora albida]|uniref:hypothetical protein n=1 Tax=Longispora albida TaxID=203523 RepID=UPI00035D2A16|nr:hypothetical protein [Longispora albida]